MEILTVYPNSIEEEFFMKNLKEILDEKPGMLEKILMIFGKNRQELFKKFGKKSVDGIVYRKVDFLEYNGGDLPDFEGV